MRDHLDPPPRPDGPEDFLDWQRLAPWLSTLRRAAHFMVVAVFASLVGICLFLAWVSLFLWLREIGSPAADPVFFAPAGILAGVIGHQVWDITRRAGK